MTPRPLKPTELVDFCVHLQKQHRDELGFLPRLAFAEYYDRHQIIPAIENDDVCGYVLYFDGRNGKRPRLHPNTLKIHQACIQYDARRIEHATQIVQRVIAIAITKHFHRVEAWVATDLEANAFWSAIGFRIVATRAGGRKRDRIHNLYRYDIPATDSTATSLASGTATEPSSQFVSPSPPMVR